MASQAGERLEQRHCGETGQGPRGGYWTLTTATILLALISEAILNTGKPRAFRVGPEFES